MHKARGGGHMPGWVTGVVGTIVVSTVSAYLFLWLRCRRAGDPFGPRARWWGIAIVVITAAVSTGLAVAAVTAGGHVRAAYIGLILPSGLWLGTVSAQRRRERGSRRAGQLIGYLTLPLRCHEDRIGDDMQDWCDARLRAASKTPQWVSDAAQYYYNQVDGRLKHVRARAELSAWRESIEHKIRIVRLIGLDTTPARLEAALHSHPATRGMNKYAPDDLPRLARRLESEAQNELHLILASLYRLGYRKLLIYPFRAAPVPHDRRGTVPSAGSGPTAG